MKYTCVDASNGMEYDLKAQNNQEAIMEAFDDVTTGFDTRSWHDFDHDVRDGNTFCNIDKWADGAGEDDIPAASASIEWDFEFHTDYHTEGGYILKEIRAELFDGTEVTANSNEDFRNKIINHYQ